MKHSFRRALLFLCLLAAPVGPVASQGARAEPPSAGPGTVQTVELRPDGGAVEFLAIGRPSALRIHGKGAAPRGRLTIARDHVGGSLTFALDTLETGIGLRDRHMKETYLETARYPEAMLDVSHLDLAKLPATETFGPVRVLFEGTLTIRGVPRPVSGEAKVSRNGSRLAATAAFSIKLRDFGIDVPQYVGITVADKVDVKTSFSADVESAPHVATR